MEAVIDWDKVFPDHELSIADKGIQALNFGKHVRFYSDLKRLAPDFIDVNKPFKDYSKKEWDWISSAIRSFSKVDVKSLKL